MGVKASKLGRKKNATGVGGTGARKFTPLISKKGLKQGAGDLGASGRYHILRKFEEDYILEDDVSM